ncbi:Di-copper centre-containing protein [Paxillus ammoniavirescens]|nr:Di-copper centre-containing protein [Paxillus ammoniavirescens]
MFTQPRNFYPVVGRADGVFERLPVEELQATEPYQWTLFVLGYAWIQGKAIPFPGVVQPPLTPAASLMEIGGIHGKPYREYSGDGRPPAEASSDFNYLDKKDTGPVIPRFGGYCNHASVNFTTWHRPYMMLIEQAIGEYATNVAEQLDNAAPEAVWVPAARRLRFPYWDWADPKVDNGGLPDLFYSDTLTVTAPGGQPVTVPNPLSTFRFPYIPEDFRNVTNADATAYFQEWPETYRHAPSTPAGGSNIQDLQDALKEAAPRVRQSVGLLFTFPDQGDSSLMYDEFSNTRNESRRTMDYYNRGSLEAPHNTMHGVLGGNGHMGDPDYAAYDPIFYFHHANVDRILALWEWCYTNYWMNDGYVHGAQDTKYPWTQSLGTYAQVYNAVLEPTGENGTLAPFRHQDGTYWTNDQTRFLTANSYPKYYSYKEFVGIKVDTPALDPAEQRLARARIASYYGINPTQSKQRTQAPSWTHIPVPGSEVEIPQNFKLIESYRHFVVLVRLPEHAFGRSYNFNLYYNGTLVGSTTVFTREINSPCAACANRRANASVVRGVIYVPPNIVDEIIADKIASPDGAMENAVNLITGSFQGKLLDLSGKELASAEGGADVGIVPASDAAVGRVLPAEITLYSAAVAEHDNPEEPVQFLDWKPHNELFPSGWKALADEAR